MADTLPPASIPPGIPLTWPPAIAGYSYIDNEPVAEGGQAQIYRVTQTSMQRPAYCKIRHRRHLESQLAQTTDFARGNREQTVDGVQRLMDEATTTSCLLSSGYVPAVYDQGLVKVECRDANNQKCSVPWPYFIMERIEGSHLDRLRTQGQEEIIPFRQLDDAQQDLFLRVLEGIARGLSHAHQCGIVHRDLSPRNVLLASGERVKIIDWGIARQAGEPSDSMGTIGYKAPEQLRVGADQAAETNAVTPLSDIYSLGRIGYFLLTGRPPRDRTPEEVRDDVRQTGAPTFWVDLIIRCLCQAPEGRPSAAEVVVAIDRYPREQEEAKQKAKETAQKANRRTERWRWAAALILLTAISTSTAIVLWSQKKIAEQEKDAADWEKRRANVQMRLWSAITDWHQGKREKAIEVSPPLLDMLAKLAEERPEDKLTLYLLGGAYHTVGDMFYDAAGHLAEGKHEQKQKRLAQALEYYDLTIKTLEPLRPDFPDVQEVLARCHAACARAHVMRQQWTEGLMANDEAVRLGFDANKVLKVSFPRRELLRNAFEEQRKLPWFRPPHPDYAKAVRLADYLLDALTRAAAEEQVAPPVAKTATANRAKAPGIFDLLSAAVKGSVSSWRDSHTYNAACIHARATDDPEATPEERERRAVQAITYLNRIADGGYFRVAAKLNELDKDRDLDRLRDRSDFKALLQRIGTKQ